MIFTEYFKEESKINHKAPSANPSYTIRVGYPEKDAWREFKHEQGFAEKDAASLDVVFTP